MSILRVGLAMSILWGSLLLTSCVGSSGGAEDAGGGDSAAGEPAADAGPDARIADAGLETAVPDAPLKPATPEDAERPVSQDASSDAATDGSCLRPLSEFSFDCPSNYADIESGRVSCITYEDMDVGECATDHLLIFRRAYGTHTATCFYDPQSRALTAGILTNDTPICGESHTVASRPLDFCNAPCTDGCETGADARIVPLTRIKRCCQRWAYPIPGCSSDASAPSGG